MVKEGAKKDPATKKDQARKKLEMEIRKLQTEIFDYCELHEFHSHITQMMREAFDLKLQNPWSYFIEYIKKNILVTASQIPSANDSSATISSSASSLSPKMPDENIQNSPEAPKANNVQKTKSKGKKPIEKPAPKPPKQIEAPKIPVPTQTKAAESPPPLISIPNERLDESRQTSSSALRRANPFMLIPKKKLETITSAAQETQGVQPSTSKAALEKDKQTVAAGKKLGFKLKIPKLEILKLSAEEKQAPKHDSEVLFQKPAAPKRSASNLKLVLKRNSSILEESDRSPPTKIRIQTPSITKCVTIHSSNTLPPLIRVHDEGKGAEIAKSVETCEDVVLKEPGTQNSQKVYTAIDNALAELHGMGDEQKLSFIGELFEAPEQQDTGVKKMEVDIFNTEDLANTQKDKASEDPQKSLVIADEQPSEGQKDTEVKVIDKKAQVSIFDTEEFSEDSQNDKPKVETQIFAAQSEESGKFQKSVENIEEGQEAQEIAVEQTTEGEQSAEAPIIEKPIAGTSSDKPREEIDDTKAATEASRNEIGENKAQLSIFDTEDLASSDSSSEILIISSDTDDNGSAQKSSDSKQETLPKESPKEEEVEDSEEMLPIKMSEANFNDEFEPDYEPDDE